MMIAEGWHALRIYRKLMTLHIRASLEYEADFWIGLVGMGLTHGAGFVFVWVFFSNVPQIQGWGLWDTAFLYALSVIPRGLAELLTDGVWNVRVMINQGELDRLLVRPISPLLQMVTSLSSIHGLGNILVGIAILMRAAQALQLDWHLSDLLWLGVILVNAVVMITAISLLANCVGFWEPATTGSLPNLIYQLLEFSKFPLTVYDRFVQLFFTWVLPFAFVSYYPSLLLLRKTDPALWLAYVTPFTSVVVGAIAAVVWRVGLARYQSTGH